VDSKITNEWVLNKAGVKRVELLDTVKARKLAYYGHTMRKQGNCLEKEIMQGTMPGVRRRGRPCTAWIDNVKSWAGLTVEESIRRQRIEINGESTSMVWPTLGSRTAKEQNNSAQCCCPGMKLSMHNNVEPFGVNSLVLLLIYISISNIRVQARDLHTGATVHLWRATVHP